MVIKNSYYLIVFLESKYSAVCRYFRFFGVNALKMCKRYTSCASEKVEIRKSNTVSVIVKMGKKIKVSVRTLIGNLNYLELLLIVNLFHLIDI